MKDRWEILDIPIGKICEDWFDEGVRCIIMRGSSSLCAYVGVPLDHPLSGFNYDDIPLDCHGGLTFSRQGRNGSKWPEGFWFYGWDYEHLGDAAAYQYEIPSLTPIPDEKEWTVKQVKEEFWSVLYDFKRLVKLAEQIQLKKESPAKERG